MLDDALTITGRVQLELRDEQGLLKQLIEVDNLVTNYGKPIIANRMIAAQAMAAISHMAVGTVGTAVDVNNGGLFAEIVRIALGSTTVVAAVITYAATFGPGVGTGALQEALLSNSATAGNPANAMARVTFGVINKAAGDTLNVSWTVTIG